MDPTKISEIIDQEWDASATPTLEKYISIPNQSPLFDKEWATNGYLDSAVELLAGWARSQDIAGMNIEVVRVQGKTPVIFITIDGSDSTQETVLMYGHCDKQPPMPETWEEGLGPFKPVIKNGRLYGRGGADDGYSIFSALLSIKALQKTGQKHSRIVVLIEACEESGSLDLPTYIELLAPRIGSPTLIVCLDSGAGNYEQMWMTTSLRGLVFGVLTVQVLTEGVHSGDASGVVPSSFRIMRQLLSRIEDIETGKVTVPEFHTSIPEARLAQAKLAATELGSAIHDKFPWAEGAKPVAEDLVELLLNKTWRPALSITGADGLPSCSVAGNVLRTHTSLALSLRIPPGVSGPEVGLKLKEILERDPPYGAKVTFNFTKAGNGWNAPEMPAWLVDSVKRASETYYQKEACYMGEGGSIPFMHMLGQRFPKAQFVITGVLGPNSNAHGPNEFLDIPFAKKITCCVANIINDHFNECAK